MNDEVMNNDDDIILFSDDEGNEISGRILDYFFYNGQEYALLTEDIEFVVHHILNGEKVGFCPGAILYDEQPIHFTQSWRQRIRWAKGYLQVFRKYGPRLMLGALRGNFACYDMSMVIMPAIVLTSTSFIANAILAVIGAVRGETRKPVDSGGIDG